MTNKPLLTGLAAVGLAGLAGLGCSAASASAKPGPAAPAHPAAAAHITAFTTDDGPTDQVILTGAVADYGQAVSVNPDGSVNPEHNGQLELKLTQGTFRLDTAALDKAFVAAMASRFPTDRATCSGSLAVTQQVPVVKGAGTGAYKGADGSFTLTITLDEVDKPAAGRSCDGTQAFVSQTIVITGPGAVTF